MFIRHRKCDLGRVAAREPVVATDADHVIAEKGDERHAVVVVDSREASDLAVAQLRALGPKKRKYTLCGDWRCEERTMGGRVVRPDGSDVHRAAVGEHGIDRPAVGIVGRKWLAHALLTSVESGTVTRTVVPCPTFRVDCQCPADGLGAFRQVAHAETARRPLAVEPTTVVVHLDDR